MNFCGVKVKHLSCHHCLLLVEVYDQPTCWTVVPLGFNSASIFAAYEDKIYKIDHITSKEMVTNFYPTCG